MEKTGNVVVTLFTEGTQSASNVYTTCTGYLLEAETV
jgi:hypothetical protein